MRFSQLLTTLPTAEIQITLPTDPEITAPISEDSRTVQPGGLFLARRGQSFDGHNRIPEALERGAAAIIGELPFEQLPPTPTPFPYVQVRDPQITLGLLASAYYGHPSHKLIVIGVTGTDGKTTTSNLVYHLLKGMGIAVGMISTVNAVIGDQTLDTGLHVTTPTAPEIQSYLARMVNAGLTHCILETTSHGLAQKRVHGVEYDVAVMTNVTHEHLDFHGTWESYREAKALLFRMTRDGKPKPQFDYRKAHIINADDPSADYFAASSTLNRITYYALSLNNPHTPIFYAKRITHTPTETHLEIGFSEKSGLSLPLTTPMVGDYNISNLLAAVSAVYVLCHPSDLARFIETIQSALMRFPPIPGRMERIIEGQPYTALVDFAHTPNALNRALEAARTLVEPGKRVICVFGCAGLRDREKRDLMAATSVQLADLSIFTAEDPRTESLDAILERMAVSAVKHGGIEGETFWRIPDRGQALVTACNMAQPGDLVIACGKGHEQSMCFGAIEYAWDDRAALRSAIRGIPHPGLPTNGQ